jgi:hypothetical protein
MNTPFPYNFNGPDAIINSPISYAANASVNPFPCQGKWNTTQQVTSVAAGSTQLFNFTASIVHGGGSCQFLLTYDSPPPADPSKWRVLQTIFGGCPAQTSGNLANVYASDPSKKADGVHCGNDTGIDCVRQFEIPIDADLAAGNATIAWGWFNNLGNREVRTHHSPPPFLVKDV